ncbi:oligopeptide/dipeptide ABC transporter ATP-binding protein [Nonomuraea ferruginea]
MSGADYVAAARMLRVPRHRILARHVLPNIAEPLILNLTQALGGALLGLAGMSFLGLGVQPPDYDWGRLLFDGFGRIYIHPEVALGPAAAIALAGIGFNLLGDALARRAARTPVRTPRSRQERLGRRRGRGETQPGAVLDVAGLTVTFPGGVTPVRGVSLSVRPGEIVGLVGESGSGKSLTAAAVGGLVPYPGTVSHERLRLCGEDVPNLSRKQLGTSLAMVFQDPMASLNPALKIGGQLAEVAVVHQGATREDARRRAVDRLGHVHLPEPEKQAARHPHQLSGGMRQRAVIAMGLMGDPKLIIADEPTTALDVTVQRQILRLLREVAEESGAGALFISHDIAVVGELCDRVVVMYAGRVVEELPVDRLADGAAHPYTRALISSLPDMDTDRALPLASIPGRQPAPAEVGASCAFAPGAPPRHRPLRHRPARAGGTRPRPPGRLLGGFVRIDDLTVRYGAFTAVDKVTLEIPPGRIVGLVGESGSGKSSVARAVSGLVPHTGSVTGASRIQMIFQDPYASLDPRMRVGDSVGEALLHLPRRARAAEVTRLLGMVSLPPRRRRRATRASCRAASASASPSPAPSPPTPTSWSPTRSPAPWTCRCRGPSST